MTSSPNRLPTLLGVAGIGLIAAAIWIYIAQQRGTPPASDAAAVTDAGPPIDLTKTLPFDERITRGTLPNGLRYLVRANRHPEKRAELRLVVDAGSVLEDDDQRGMAHFVEHMAFNGTARFPRQELVAFLESTGVRFGPGINATTSFDETIYQLQIPTDKPELLNRALDILEDWAHRVTFDPGEIEKERPVIIEEWRLRRTARQRLFDQQMPLLLKGSRYADRMPIGTPESIRSGSAARLKQFYADWYRPDLMWIIAVGDFDQDAVASRIAKQFAAIPARADKRSKPPVEMTSAATPPGTTQEFLVVEDPEATASTVTLADTHPRVEPRTAGDYRRALVDRLITGMFSQRLADVAQTPSGPLVAAAVSAAPIVRSVDLISMAGTAKTGQSARAVEAIAVERARLLRFGLTAPELDRQKTIVLRALSHAIAERDRLVSATLAAEYVRHAVNGEAVPGLDWENTATKSLLAGIGLEEVNRVVTETFGPLPRVVTATTTPRAKSEALTTASLERAIADAGRASLVPWVARVTADSLLETEPAPGSITSTNTRANIGVTEWTLSNGARVVLLPTNFKEDQIVFSAVSPGGISLAPDSALVPAQTAAQLVNSMGFGRFSSGDLRRWLAGRNVAVQPVIGPFEEGLSGGSTRGDVETMFQLIHLMVTSPRRDPVIFEAVRSQMRDALLNQASSPDVAFMQELASALSQGHPRVRPLTPEAADRMDLDASLTFFRERFADASDFTFVFAGSFDLAMMRPLVERYLASLPALRRGEKWIDPGVRPPRGVVGRVVERGVEPRSRTAIVFTGEAAPDRSRAVVTVALAEVLQTRLRTLLREELGGTYSVNVGGSLARVPIGQYTISIDFTSDPQRAQALANQVFAEIDRLRRTGPTSREVDDVRTGLLRDFESNSRQNQFLVAQLAQRYQSGEAPDSVWQMPAIYKALTPAMILEAARRDLDAANYVKVVLTPQK